MARRRRRGGSGQGNLDSLLDTMTNVVGVLIVVLIVTQVNVSSAAKRIRADLPDVTVAMMEEMVEKDEDRKSTRLNSSHALISYAVFCLKKKK